MVRVSSSRRVAALKPNEYDHEIGLVDHDKSQSPPSTSHHADLQDPALPSTSLTPPAHQSSSSDEREDEPTRAQPRPAPADDPQRGREDGPEADLTSSSGDLQPDASHLGPVSSPSIEVHGKPTLLSATALHSSILTLPPAPPPSHNPPQDSQPSSGSKLHGGRETAIDILYQNERGGFLCGTALFSCKALGGLDPTPWTNAFHKPSPVSIYTAQVPDPSWEWVWPEWRINHQDGDDEDGWEYSFAFGHVFSWHAASWWNSFVRRRAWTRKRARRPRQDASLDPYMLSTDYFRIRPASYSSFASVASSTSSRALRRLSIKGAIVQVESDLSDLGDIETLMQTLRLARIDREKQEAIESYLDQATDLAPLQSKMHEIMALFVFQASRRQLLGHLRRKLDESKEELASKGNRDKAELRTRLAALEAAITHADEEVRKLSYWSDIKQMAVQGELGNSLCAEEPGLDASGPTGPNADSLPPSSQGQGGSQDEDADTPTDAVH